MAINSFIQSNKGELLNEHTEFSDKWTNLMLFTAVQECKTKKAILIIDTACRIKASATDISKMLDDIKIVWADSPHVYKFVQTIIYLSRDYLAHSESILSKTSDWSSYDEKEINNRKISKIDNDLYRQTTMVKIHAMKKYKTVAEIAKLYGEEDPIYTEEYITNMPPY